MADSKKNMTDSIQAAKEKALHQSIPPTRPPRPSIEHPHLTVLSSIVETSAGRDKTLKVVQYAAKSYVFAIKSVVGAAQASSWEAVKRLEAAAGSLSLARKCMILFSPLTPFLLLLQSHWETPIGDLLASFIALLNGIADDLFCLSRLGLLSKAKGLWADKWANRFWFLKTVHNLLKMETQRKALSAQEAARYLRNNFWKYVKGCCDAVFSAYNVFGLVYKKELVQNCTGLLAGLVSVSMLYQTHKEKLYSAV